MGLKLGDQVVLFSAFEAILEELPQDCVNAEVWDLTGKRVLLDAEHVHQDRWTGNAFSFLKVLQYGGWIFGVWTRGL